MTHTKIDRRGGHQPGSMIEDEGGNLFWTPHQKFYAKRFTRREMRREQERITRHALLAASIEADEVISDWLEETRQHDELCAFYEDDWQYFEDDPIDDSDWFYNMDWYAQEAMQDDR